MPVLAIVFIATVIRSAFGFGEALVAVPLLAFFMPMPVATPLAVLLSTTVAAVVVAQDWKHIHLRSAAGLMGATVFGIPLGLLLLAAAHQQLIKLLLGILIILFALFLLKVRDILHLEHEHKPLLLLTGFVAGILGGAFGMNGPPLVVYGSLRRWSPQQFRATLQAYFLPASSAGLLGFWSSGLWTRTVTHEFLLSAPVMLPAVLVGRAINHRFSGGEFVRYLYFGLILIGIMLIAEAARRPA